jgi:YHS domain-containing protein
MKKIHAKEDQTKVYHEGAHYVVCCASCAAKFEAHPEQYISSL